MSFGWPIALLGLVLVALALIAYIVVQHRRRRYVVRFTNFDLLENIVADSPRWRRHIPAAFALLALTALAIFLTSGRPVFYRGARVGRAGHLFWMYKFRTLKPDAEDRLGPYYGAELTRRTERRT